ncbi:MAG: hypothetical protein VB049_00930 [Candidatus Pelethousia sp.]|nr:hypothetical protein [Candidatus Pelethousia sp.]
MSRKILSLMVLYGISKQEMAACLCMSLDTFYRRLKKPDDFTFGELRKAAKKLKTTVSAITDELK